MKTYVSMCLCGSKSKTGHYRRNMVPGQYVTRRRPINCLLLFLLLLILSQKFHILICKSYIKRFYIFFKMFQF